MTFAAILGALTVGGLLWLADFRGIPSRIEEEVKGVFHRRGLYEGDPIRYSPSPPPVESPRPLRNTGRMPGSEQLEPFPTSVADPETTMKDQLADETLMTRRAAMGLLFSSMLPKEKQLALCLGALAKEMDREMFEKAKEGIDRYFMQRHGTRAPQQQWPTPDKDLYALMNNVEYPSEAFTTKATALSEAFRQQANASALPRQRAEFC